MAYRAGRLGVRRWSPWEEGPGAFLSPECPASALGEALWRMSVEDEGEDTLNALKEASTGVSCSVPCQASHGLWRSHQTLEP